MDAYTSNYIVYLKSIGKCIFIPYFVLFVEVVHVLC